MITVWYLPGSAEEFLARFELPEVEWTSQLRRQTLSAGITLMPS